MKLPRKQRLWKLYFALYCAAVVIAYLLGIGDNIDVAGQFGLLVSLVMTVIGLVGLYGYIWRQQIVNRSFWMVFVAIEVISASVSFGWPIVRNFIEAANAGVMVLLEVFAVQAIILALVVPIVYAHVVYAFTKTVFASK